MSALVEEAKRLHPQLRALGDEDGAARAGLEVAKLLFWIGHVQSALDMAQELLATGASGRVADDIRGWVVTFAYWGPTPAPDGIDLAKRMAAEMSDPRLYLNRRRVRSLASSRCRVASTRRERHSRRNVRWWKSWAR